MAEQAGASILCIDDDRGVAGVVQAILTDEGYAVSCAYMLDHETLLRAVGRLEPDCVLLDSSSATDYGDSWRMAATLRERHRPVPVIMFTAHPAALAEAEEAETERAVAADFAGILAKPFHLDDLLAVVATAVGRSHPFERSTAAEAERTKALVSALKARGATDIAPSRLREWALFRDRGGALVQLYWWQGQGVYQVGRYAESGKLVMLGLFVDRGAAIEVALPPDVSLPAPARTSARTGAIPARSSGSSRVAVSSVSRISRARSRKPSIGRPPRSSARYVTKMARSWSSRRRRSI
jgi:DNA-binding response OmpR family regulator